ncbi:hypothetical protein RN001_013169 [Aquatica leii]|uniref:FLYWCH-type domain-containing protein n=1 Tax=Aquatica leii TaxID=1421715 RepID=A0AAN7SDP6_9COLE|nr:hypothetical protein RN001_013169 [Aquatica leii]
MDNAILSKRGKQKCSHNGFLYVFDTVSKNDESVKFWRCEQKERCKVRVHTRNEAGIIEINLLSHDSFSVSVEVAQVLTNVKKRAAETMGGTFQVINECVANITQACQGKLPNNCALRKVVRRKRNEIQAAPPNPIRLEDLIIPERYKIYERQPGLVENFLLADSEGPNRILIFGRESWLEHLRAGTTWYADGTFSIAPHLFTQVYTIMAVRNNGVHLIFYALLPDKLWATYMRMFDLIKEIVPNLQSTEIIVTLNERHLLQCYTAFRAST